MEEPSQSNFDTPEAREALRQARLDADNDRDTVPEDRNHVVPDFVPFSLTGGQQVRETKRWFDRLRNRDRPS